MLGYSAHSDTFAKNVLLLMFRCLHAAHSDTSVGREQSELATVSMINDGVHGEKTSTKTRKPKVSKKVAATSSN